VNSEKQRSEEAVHSIHPSVATYPNGRGASNECHWSRRCDSLLSKEHSLKRFYTASAISCQLPFGETVPLIQLSALNAWRNG